MIFENTAFGHVTEVPTLMVVLQMNFRFQKFMIRKETCLKEIIYKENDKRTLYNTFMFTDSIPKGLINC